MAMELRVAISHQEGLAYIKAGTIAGSPDDLGAITHHVLQRLEISIAAGLSVFSQVEVVEVQGQHPVGGPWSRSHTELSRFLLPSATTAKRRSQVMVLGSGPRPIAAGRGPKRLDGAKG